MSRRFVRIIFSLVLLGVLTPAAHAATCYAVNAAAANWNVTTTWANASGGVAGTCAGTGVPAGTPGVADSAVIGEALTARAVNIPAGFAAQAASVAIGSNTNNAKSLTLSAATSSLTVAGNVTINKPANSVINALNVNAGTVVVGGAVTLAGATGTAGRVAEIVITTGTLTINGALTFTAGVNANNVIDMSGGAGTINLKGAFTATVGTLTSSATSVFNFNGSAAAQTIPIGVGLIVYSNLYANNTNASGATLSAAITAARVTGDLRVQSGTLSNGGFAITGVVGKTFQVANGATFKLTGSVMATGFTNSFGATSTVNYNQLGGTQNVSVETYGHLVLDNGGTKRMLAGTTTIAGNFTLGATTTYDGTTNNPVVNLAGNFTNSGTFNSGTGVFTFNGTAAGQTISGGATTFSALTIANTNAAGVTPSVALTIGTFIVNASSTFNAGALSHSVTGNFTNNGTFNVNTSTFTFNGGAAQAITGATTFYDLVFNNAAGFTLNNNVTASNTLTLTSGVIATGVANTLIYSSTTSCSVTRTSGRVNGNLRKSFTASLLTCDFEIGDATNYTPVNVSFSSVSASGTVTAKATGGVHPQISTAPLDSTTPNLVNRYWMLTPGGGLIFSDTTLTFTPIGGSPVDHDNTANVGNYSVQRYEISGGSCDPADAGYTGAGSWNNTTETGVQTTTSIATMGISSFGSICSHIAIGLSSISGFLREKEFIYNRELFY